MRGYAGARRHNTEEKGERDGEQMIRVRFTRHAENKFAVLSAHGCLVTRERVLEVLAHPDAVVEGYRARRIAQGWLNNAHVLRVVFEEHEDERVVVTFYPGRRSRYEGPI